MNWPQTGENTEELNGKMDEMERLLDEEQK